MSRVLSELWGYPPARLAQLITALESSHDGAAIDVQLIGDIAAASSRAHRLLAIDPADTAPQELYGALRTRASDDNATLARLVGGSHPSAVSEMTPLIVQSLQTQYTGQQCWALKSSVAKKLLRQHLPAQTRQLLGYRSVDSLLKHESALELMTVARYLEDDVWQQALLRSYTALRPTDFEQRPLTILYLDKAVYAKALAPTLRRHHLVLHCKEMGVVAIAPTPEKVIRGYTLRTWSLAQHYLHEVLAMSSLLKHRQTTAHYGAQVIAALDADDSGHVPVASHYFHWRGVHAHIATQPAPYRSDTALHMSAEDWQWSSVNDMIGQLAPELALWHGRGYVAAAGPVPVGFNIVDIAIDESLDAAFAARSLKYLRRDLETEALRRYLDNAQTRRLLFARMGIDFVEAPEH